MTGGESLFSGAPYPGLRPFRSEESDIFFGRERQADQLLARLGRHRFLAVTGPSGCGKSSLVLAGMIPALNAGFMVQAGSRWRVATLRPGEHPLANLAAAIATPEVLGGYRASADGRPAVEAALRRGPLGLVDLLRTSTALQGANLLVLVDQFEELFRYRQKADPEEADAFVALLLASAAAADVPVYVVLTMRSDYLGDCALFRGLPEMVSDAQFLTPRLTRDEVTSAVTGPARVFGGSVSAQLVNRVVNDFGSDPDRLPLLQHAMMRMWNRRSAATAPGQPVALEVDDYERIGGVERALSDHADEALAELETERGRRIAELMFRRLTERASGRRDIRAPAKAEEVAAVAGVAVDEVAAVVQVFRRRDRSFVVAADERLVGETVLDIGHEALIRYWTRLAGWVEAEAASAKMFRRLVDTGQLHRQEHAQLWGEPNLSFALRWKRDEAPTPQWAARYGTVDEYGLAMAFLDASQAARARELAEEERRRTAELRHARVVAGLSFAVAVALVLAYLVHSYLWRWEHVAYFRDAVKVRGALVGQGELSASASRRRGVSYEVVTRGVLGVTVRATLNRAPLAETGVSSSIGTYLEYGEGTSADAIRVEYDYDKDEFVTRERAYDRDHRHVWTFAYMPRERGVGTTRVGSYLGPDGLPLSRRYAVDQDGPDRHRRYAEAFVFIDYDRDGRDAIVRYRTRAGKPVAGKDRAYGQKYAYDAAGFRSATISLGPDDQPMNDVVGNAVSRTRRDRAGNLVEEILEDADGKVVGTAAGWARAAFRHDGDGRLVEATYYDEASRPVTSREGMHRATYRHDDGGAVVEERYFDVAGGPAFSREEGCHGYDRRPDVRGHAAEVVCIGADDRPTASKRGWARLVRRHDAQGNLLEERYLDAAGAPVVIALGYSRIMMEYDARGARTSFAAFGVDGAPVVTRDGYWRVRSAYDDRGNLLRSDFFGTDGKPVLLADGHASLEQRFDAEGNLERTMYLGADGRPSVRPDGTAGSGARFDALGHQVEFWYVDVDGGRTLGPDGNAGEELDFDASGYLRRITFTGLHGEPVSTKDGIAGWTSTHDERGNELSRSFVDPLNGPVTHRLGFAAWRASYDRQGNELRREYRDLTGNPVIRPEDPDDRNAPSGYAVLERTYDRRGHVVEERFLGRQGQLTHMSAGYARATFRRDAAGNPVETAYFGAFDERVLVDGRHRVERDHDAAGRIVEVRFYSTTGALTESSHGYARAVFGFDHFGRTTSTAYFSAAGAPAAPQGFHRLTHEYDPRGRVVATRYHGADGKPAVSDAGFHAELRTYDALGRAVQIDHVGADGKLALRRDAGYARSRSQYDARGRETEIQLYGADERPVEGSEGWSRLVQAFDVRGNMIESAAFGRDGDRVAVTRGAAIVRTEFGPRGEAIRKSYLGPDGKAVLVSRNDEGDGGYAAEALRYDVYGNQVEASYFGRAGERVMQLGGYHRMVMRRDARGQVVESATYDTRGRLVVNGFRYARATKRYDERGNIAEIAAYDARGALTSAHFGYARMVITWDPRGNKASERYYGPHGGLAPLPGGACGIDWKYDDQGNAIEEIQIGPAGRPADASDGFARAARRFDERGRKLEERYFAADRRPARVRGDGQHLTRFTYDDRGNVAEERYFDERGRPSAGYHDFERCSVWTATYDDEHKQIESWCRPPEPPPRARAPGPTEARASR